jgi:hypothetical protein
MSESSARISLAGEYLAASYLLRYCDSVILAPPGHRSDLILDHDNHLYRVQVKTTNTVYQEETTIFIVGNYAQARELLITFAKIKW